MAQPDEALRALNSEPAVNGPRQEVYCTKIGTTHPDEMYIIGAHIDGHGWGEAANDDGSGTALAMELARIFNAPDVVTERSIRALEQRRRGSTRSIMIGKILAHYEITSELGKGGTGEVYRATDTKLEQNHAIKVLPAAFTEDRERLARFEREAKLLAALNHPNIAHVYGIESAMSTPRGPTRSPGSTRPSPAISSRGRVSSS